MPHCTEHQQQEQTLWGLVEDGLGAPAPEPPAQHQPGHLSPLKALAASAATTASEWAHGLQAQLAAHTGQLQLPTHTPHIQEQPAQAPPPQRALDALKKALAATAAGLAHGQAQLGLSAAPEAAGGRAGKRFSSGAGQHAEDALSAVDQEAALPCVPMGGATAYGYTYKAPAVLTGAAASPAPAQPMAIPTPCHVLKPHLRRSPLASPPPPPSPLLACSPPSHMQPQPISPPSLRAGLEACEQGLGAASAGYASTWGSALPTPFAVATTPAVHSPLSLASPGPASSGGSGPSSLIAAEAAASASAAAAEAAAAAHAGESRSPFAAPAAMRAAAAAGAQHAAAVTAAAAVAGGLTLSSPGSTEVVVEALRKLAILQEGEPSFRPALFAPAAPAAAAAVVSQTAPAACDQLQQAGGEAAAAARLTRSCGGAGEAAAAPTPAGLEAPVTPVVFAQHAQHVAALVAASASPTQILRANLRPKSMEPAPLPAKLPSSDSFTRL